MNLQNLDHRQMWAFVMEDAVYQDTDDPRADDPPRRVSHEVVCNGCGAKYNMATILTLKEYRDECFECDAHWLDRELEGWC